MTRHELNLTPKESKILDGIEKKISSFRSLEKRMDYVDEIVLWTYFPDLEDDVIDNMDEYLRDFVSNTM